jgi:membrane associated rhomboid family serine protease
MGLADRDYQQNTPPGGGGFMPRLTPVVKWLLIANIGIFVLDYLILPLVFDIRVDELRKPPIFKWGAFSVESALMQFRLWELITFQFIHGGLTHVLFNCMGLYFFGPWLERWWGSLRFIVFYLLCGIAGAAFYTLLMLLHVVPGDFQSGLVGASAGIYGILIGVAVIAPNLRVLLMFVIELSMRQLAIVLMVISTGAILFNIGGNEGGEAGHLGGAILGFILMRFPWLLGGDTNVETIRPKAFTSRSDAKLRPRSELRMDQDDAVDIILDKVSREGFQSLTQAERDILLKASERQHNDP